MSASGISDGSGVDDQNDSVRPPSHQQWTNVGKLHCRASPLPAVGLIMPSQSLPDAEVPLSRPLLLGRCPEADLQVRDPWISRRHCQFAAIENEVFVRDLGSKHGTFVNQEPVKERLLRDGDELRIGLLRFVVVYDD